MKLRFVDCECFAHWWTIIYCDLPEDTKDITANYVYKHCTVIQSSYDNARDRAMLALYEPDTCLVGYNIKHYDLIIFNAIFEGFDPEQVHMVNDLIIHPGLYDTDATYRRMAGFAKKILPKVVYQDLMDDGPRDVSLKENEAILGLNIYESTVSFDKEDLTEEDKAELIKYCTYDVFAAIYYYEHVAKSYVTNKLVLAKTFNISEAEAYKNTNANLVGKALGAKRQSFSDSDTLEIELPDKIKQYVYKNVDHSFINYLQKTPASLDCVAFGNKVTFGDGGLHSVLDTSIYIEEDDEYMIMNNDASSYYPHSMLSFNCLSRTIPEPELFREILNERITLKNKDNRTEEEDMRQKAYKLVLNTTYGAGGNQYLTLYDPYMRSKLCRIDQLFLAALAGKMYKTIPGLQVIQTNTDATTLYFPRKYLNDVLALAQEWTDISGIPMEQDYIHRIWQRDVNNYLIEMCNGKIKRKGSWLIDTEDKNGLNSLAPLSAFACTKAAQQFLLNGAEPTETLVKDYNLKDFVITCKKGPTFRGVVQRMSDGREVELMKCNRIIATTKKEYGMLYKYKMVRHLDSMRIQYNQMPNTPEHCMLVNKDLSTYAFMSNIRPILDYTYYITRIADILDCDWMQLVGDKFYKTNRFDYLK